MVKSMTGYGKAERAVEKKKIKVELRSLNSKALDITFKMPAHYREKENALRTSLTRVVQRGKVEVLITLADEDAEAPATLNRQRFVAYYRQIDSLLQSIGSSAKKERVAQVILRLPEVMDTSSTEVPDTEWDTLLLCLQEALTDFDRFREDEGRALLADIQMRVDRIVDLLASVSKFEQQRIESVRQRIGGLLTTIGQPSYDKNRFEQELLYYLEKIDITEEKIRLVQHCKYFMQTIEEGAGVGRKLGFIAQEMGREINTLGSKANQVDIQKLVVQMKDELEKMKEQILNVL
ncbi:MAG: YicC family protein [Prevotellaceae bacterium]|jgi:uncharacterized protein (TIGR00255 family)|nr:YicC family protein [Prevotellaceae bacterium]